MPLPVPAITVDPPPSCVAWAVEEELIAPLRDIERAFADLDPDGLNLAADQLRLVLPCLRAPARSSVAARLHRGLALVAWTQGDREGARASLASARRLEPGVRLDPAVVPEGHPLHEVWGQLGEVEVQRIKPPLEGTLWFDGQANLERPLGVPTLVQYDLGGGHLAWTTLVGAAAPLPEYPRRVDRSGRDPLLRAAGVSAGVSLLLLGGAGLARAGFERWEPAEGSGPEEIRDGLQRRAGLTNSLLVGSAVSGGVAVGWSVAWAVP